MALKKKGLEFGKLEEHPKILDMWEKIGRVRRGCSDWETRFRDLSVAPLGDEELTLDGPWGAPLPFKNAALSQLVNRVVKAKGGAAAYLSSLVAEGHAGLAATNLRYWLDLSPKSSLLSRIRIAQDTTADMASCIRMVGSLNYSALNYDDLFQMVLETTDKAGLALYPAVTHIADDFLHLRLVTPDGFIAPEAGQMYVGLDITNSETAKSNFSVYPSIFEVLCSNGLVSEKYRGEGYSRKHVGNMSLDNMRYWFKNALDQAPFMAGEYAEKYGKAAARALEADFSDEKLGNKLAKTWGLTQGMGERVVGRLALWEKPSVLSLVRAVTEEAQKEDAAARLRLERIADEILCAA